MPPAFVQLAIERDVHERAPFRALGFADELHPALIRQAVTLARVARNARADDVFPRGQAAFVARDDVIEIQVAAVEMLAAILAGGFVAPQENLPGELYFPSPPAVGHEQHQ